MGGGHLPWLGGYLPWMGGGTYLGPGEEVPTLARGDLPWLGEGVPTLARWRGTYLGQGEGVPTLAGGGGTLPQVWTYKQIEPITFPHPTDTGGNN